MTPEQRNRVEAALKSPVLGSNPLSGGCIADVQRVSLANGRVFVVKTGTVTDRLDIEGRSLTCLRSVGGLPTPTVWLMDADLLVMDWLPNDGGLSGTVQEDAASHIARLHDATSVAFGLDEDTRIGPLHQPNPRTDRWIEFFRDQRLRHMGQAALASGNFSAADFDALERLAARLDSLIDEPDRPALLHGDLWTGNVLSSGGRITGFIDPAIYYGHPEMDLAFSTLFGTFGDPFFQRYRELRPFDYSGFMDARRDLYNLYPLLVHTVLFGGGYGNSVSRIVRRFVG